MEHNIPLIFSSDVSLGALNVSSDGSQFSVQLDKSISVPKNAKNVTLEVDSAAIWWTVLNIESGVNDHLRVFAGATWNDIYIPQGLYDLNSLETALEKAVINLGLASDLFVIEGDSATQKVVIGFKTAGLQIDFTVTDSPRILLGYNSQFLPSSVTTFEEHIYAESVGGFSNITNFLIHSNIAGQGIPINGIYNSTIAEVKIDAPAGSLINHEPFNPIKIPMNTLAGRNINALRFWLTSQSNKAVNTNGEVWSVRISIKYIL
jgi:hypothetical protein